MGRSQPRDKAVKPEQEKARTDPAAGLTGYAKWVVA